MRRCGIDMASLCRAVLITAAARMEAPVTWATSVRPGLEQPSSSSWRRTPNSASAFDMLDLIAGGAVSALLLLYLVWALVRPEDF
jgi:K+-transporting ATPase KdpF subunit